MPTDEQYRATARRQYARDGVVEFDDMPTVSRGADPGAYVQAWVWVADSEVAYRKARRENEESDNDDE